MNNCPRRNARLSSDNLRLNIVDAQIMCHESVLSIYSIFHPFLFHDNLWRIAGLEHSHLNSTDSRVVSNFRLTFLQFVNKFMGELKLPS